MYVASGQKQGDLSKRGASLPDLERERECVCVRDREETKAEEEDERNSVLCANCWRGLRGEGR